MALNKLFVSKKEEIKILNETIRKLTKERRRLNIEIGRKEREYEKGKAQLKRDLWGVIKKY